MSVSELADVTVARTGEELVLSLTGEVDRANVHAVRAALLEPLGNDVRIAVVDLTGTRYLDSAGLHVLFELADRLALAGGELHVVCPPASPLRRILDITRLGAVAVLRP